MWRVLQTRVPCDNTHDDGTDYASYSWMLFVWRDRSGKNSWKGKYSRKNFSCKITMIDDGCWRFRLFRFMFHNWPCAVPSSHSMITYITAVFDDLEASVNWQLLLRDALPRDTARNVTIFSFFIRCCCSLFLYFILWKWNYNLFLSRSFRTICWLFKV